MFIIKVMFGTWNKTERVKTHSPMLGATWDKPHRPCQVLLSSPCPVLLCLIQCNHVCISNVT